IDHRGVVRALQQVRSASQQPDRLPDEVKRQEPAADRQQESALPDREHIGTHDVFTRREPVEPVQPGHIGEHGVIERRDDADPRDQQLPRTSRQVLRKQLDTDVGVVALDHGERQEHHGHDVVMRDDLEREGERRAEEKAADHVEIDLHHHRDEEQTTDERTGIRQPVERSPDYVRLHRCACRDRFCPAKRLVLVLVSSGRFASASRPSPLSVGLPVSRCQDGTCRWLVQQKRPSRRVAGGPFEQSPGDQAASRALASPFSTASRKASTKAGRSSPPRLVTSRPSLTAWPSLQMPPACSAFSRDSGAPVTLRPAIASTAASISTPSERTPTALFASTIPLTIRRAWALDRKSTRLNSSHVKISYAVFCLKKNKHQNAYDAGTT